MHEMQNKTDYLPPIELTSDETPRKVGYEIEFTGMELEEAAAIIRSCYGGEIVKQHRYRFDVINTVLGDFGVELDAQILKKMAVNNSFKKFGMDFNEEKFMESVEEIVDKVAKTIVPLEIVMPPVTAEKLPEMEMLREKLQQHKAEGTKVSWVNAFGMHINVEVPDLGVQTLLNYLRSFLLVYPWLLNRLKIDLTRRISPYVDPFPSAYTELVLDVEYKPTTERFIEDYLTFNPTRNRPLDMMPLLSMIDRNKVTEALEGAKNKPRPTFHYRLPNSQIDNPEWSFMEEWSYWLIVEDLAANEEMIHKLSRLYLMRKDKILVSFNREWSETVGILLDIDGKTQARYRNKKA